MAARDVVNRRRRLFRAVVAQSYLSILQAVAMNFCLFPSFLLEPKWSQARQYESA
jgi:hypothetical protein